MNVFSLEERQELLKLARNTIGAEFKINAIQDVSKFTETKFQEKRGVFVTLVKSGKLRGCIGNILPVYPLLQAIQKNAIAAAFEDPRFSELVESEFDEINIEISVLTLPEILSFQTPEELIKKLHVGIHGVILKKGYLSATFLPQVWEELSDPEEFLSHLALKAGLHPEEWKTGTIETYEVESWEEARM
ncbi:AmmeMemoRadiSam system protein A [Candidatus Peregrinibacteria bacterium]|nr:AmmeMemoRadiSam system protein A [Candidatus Peregrinibacteria bacterium]